MGLSKERKRAERPALVASPSRGFSLVAALAAYPPLGIARVRAFSSKLTTRQTLSPPENPQQKQKQNSTPQSATSTATSARRSRASSSPECSRRTSARARPGAAATPSWCSWETFSTAGTTRSVRIGEGLSAREKRERERERERGREGEREPKKNSKLFPLQILRGRKNLASRYLRSFDFLPACWPALPLRLSFLGNSSSDPLTKTPSKTSN